MRGDDVEQPAVLIRPLRLDDALGVHDLAGRTFVDLERRLGLPRQIAFDSPEWVTRGVARIQHLVTTDAGGAWIAVLGEEPVGAALALLRDGVWGLSLLVVDPAAQSAGLGSRLLRAALAYGSGARGGIILSSEDSRALRAYARAGFALHPSVEAGGVPRSLESPASVRSGGVEDLALTEAVDRRVRGAAHGSDIRVMLEHGSRLLAVDGRGYALGMGADLRLLAATDDAAAADLLRAFVAESPAGEKVSVEWVTSRQDWALPVLLDAGLELRVGGAVFVRGDVGPFRPYLPSGPYL